MTSSLHEPTARDLPEINRLILAAKRHWGYSEALIALWQPGLLVTAADLQSRLFRIMRNDSDELIGVASVSEQDGRFELDGCWIAPQFIGQGYGRALLTELLLLLRSRSAEKLLIVSDPHAEGFYLSMGARKTGHCPSQPKGRMLPRLELML